MKIITPSQAQKGGAVDAADCMLRTSMLLDYGGALLASPIYWNIAPAYILACGSEQPTADLDERILSSVQLDCAKKADKVYALAIKHDLPRTKAHVAQTLVDR